LMRDLYLRRRIRRAAPGGRVGRLRGRDRTPPVDAQGFNSPAAGVGAQRSRTISDLYLCPSAACPASSCAARPCVWLPLRGSQGVPANQHLPQRLGGGRRKLLKVRYRSDCRRLHAPHPTLPPLPLPSPHPLHHTSS